MTWSLIPQAIVNGLLGGGTIALIALGVVLIFKSSEVFNFAHGHMLMLGAFVTWWLSSSAEGAVGGGLLPAGPGFPLWLAVTLALLFSVVLGLLIERLALRPMTGQPLLSIILMTLGLSQFLEGLAAILFGIQPQGNLIPVSPADAFVIPVEGLFLNRLTIQHARLATFVVAMVAAVLFILLFQRTKTGLAMRAASENHEVARSVGINVSNVFGLSWAIAGVIATLGGILLATLTGVSLSLSGVVLVAFPAILLGGLESLPGAIIGGLLVGLSQQLVQASTVSEIRNSAEIAPYVLLLLVLIIRPEGLFGQKRIERV